MIMKKKKNCTTALGFTSNPLFLFLSVIKKRKKRKQENERRKRSFRGWGGWFRFLMDVKVQGIPFF